MKTLLAVLLVLVLSILLIGCTPQPSQSASIECNLQLEVRQQNTEWLVATYLIECDGEANIGFEIVAQDTDGRSYQLATNGRDDVKFVTGTVGFPNDNTYQNICLFGVVSGAAVSKCVAPTPLPQ